MTVNSDPAGAFIANLADETDGGGNQALQVTASANINVGGGFRVIPGVQFRHFLVSDDFPLATRANLLSAGVSLMYSF